MLDVEDILVGVFILLFAASGLVVYIIVIGILLTQFSKKSFFLLASSLGVADCIFLLTTILYVVPSTLTGKLLHASHAFGGIINIAWFSALPLMLFMGGDRYLCMCHYKFHGKFYSLCKTKWYCLFAWLFGISYALPSFFNGCNILYDVKFRSWIWNIEENCAKVLSYGELTMVVSIAVLTFIFTALVLRLQTITAFSVYTNSGTLFTVMSTLQLLSGTYQYTSWFHVFRFLRKTRTSSTLSKLHIQRQIMREKKIFTQFFVIISCFLIFDISLITIGHVKDPSQWFGLFVTVGYISNCSINGWVYLFMNRMIRSEAKRMFRRLFRSRSSSAHQNEMETRASSVSLEIL